MPPATAAVAAVAQAPTGGSTATPHTVVITSNEVAASGHSHLRKRKRLNIARQQPAQQSSDSEDDESDEPPFFFPLSPDASDNVYNVQPLGNRLLHQSDAGTDGQLPDNTRDKSFAQSPFRHCNESLLIDILGYCDLPTLATLTSVSRSMYGLIHCHGNGELWRSLLLDDEKLTNSWQYRNGWYNTCVFAYLQHYAPTKLYLFKQHQPLRLPHFYSDYLFHQYYCTSIDTSVLCTIAKVVQSAERTSVQNTSNCNVEDNAHLSFERFVQQYEQPNIPLVVTGLMTQWKAWQDTDNPHTVWTVDNWVAQHGDVNVKCGRTTMKLRDYVQYAKTQVDEAPIYLFDSQFGEKIPTLVEQYSVPTYFDSDLFQYFSAATRPRYRWILLGPRLSGSTMHRDPNATSAWNSLMHGGRKHWILYPPDLVPPGCYPSADNSEIITPMTVAEWLVNHYSEHRRIRRKYDQRRLRAGYKTLRDVCVAFSQGHINAQEAERLTGPIEHTCSPGETIYIPHQWFHLAVNIDSELSLAVTQNYASWSNITDIFNFWSTDPHPSNKPLSAELRERLETLFPHKLEEVALTKQQQRDAAQQSATNELLKKPKVKQTVSLWDSMR